MKINILSTSIVLLLALSTSCKFILSWLLITFLFVNPIAADDSIGDIDFLRDIRSIPTQDPEWDVFYAIADKPYDKANYSQQTRDLLKSSGFIRPTAIFVYGTSQTHAFTNRTIWIQEVYDPHPFEYEDEITIEYTRFLEIFCRIPFTKNYDSKTGAYKISFDNLTMIESECERNLISKTWKGQGIGFPIHNRYEKIWTGTYRQSETRLQSILRGMFQFLSLIIPTWVLFFPAYRIVRYYHENKNPIEHSIAIAAVAVLSVGFILLVIIFGLAYVLNFSMGYSNLPVSRDLSPPGWRHYATTVGIISTFYCISAVFPFAGLINYHLLGKRTFPLWLILIGFILAPILFALLIFGLGGKRSPASTHTRTGDSGGSSSSGGVTGGGGTFGGGGASGKW